MASTPGKQEGLEGTPMVLNAGPGNARKLCKSHPQEGLKVTPRLLDAGPSNARRLCKAKPSAGPKPTDMDTNWQEAGRGTYCQAGGAWGEERWGYGVG